MTVITGAAADVTGILLAAAFAVGGFWVVPRKRRQAQQNFQRRRAALPAPRRTHPAGASRIGQSTERSTKPYAPYRRFVQSQQGRLNEARGELFATEDALLRLRTEIEKR